MEGFRRRLNSGIEKVRQYSLSLVSSGERPRIHNVLAEDTFCKDIVYSVKRLDQLSSLTTDEKIENIRRIGIASWTGGPIALKKSSSQVERFMRLLFAEESMEVKTEILKSLSQMCSLNLTLQNDLREHGHLEKIVMILFLKDPAYIELQKWTIYTLNIVIADNVDNQRYLLAVPNLKETLTLFQTESWFSWKGNEATNLLKLLFFGR